jgi:hypothetical protein
VIGVAQSNNFFGGILARMAATADYPTLGETPNTQLKPTSDNVLVIPPSPQPQRNTTRTDKKSDVEDSSHTMSPEMAMANAALMKSKKYPHCTKLNIMHNGQLLAPLILPKYESSNTSNPSRAGRIILRTHLDIKKMDYIESMINRMLDSDNGGIEIKEKKKMFKTASTAASTMILVSGIIYINF